jgi:hypothetical protein
MHLLIALQQLLHKFLRLSQLLTQFSFDGALMNHATRGVGGRLPAIGFKIQRDATQSKYVKSINCYEIAKS